MPAQAAYHTLQAGGSCVQQSATIPSKCQRFTLILPSTSKISYGLRSVTVLPLPFFLSATAPFFSASSCVLCSPDAAHTRTDDGPIKWTFLIDCSDNPLNIGSSTTMLAKGRVPRLLQRRRPHELPQREAQVDTRATAPRSGESERRAL